MAGEFEGERTEPATPRKREEARKRGQVVRSDELTTAAVLLLGTVALYLCGGRLYEALSGLVVSQLLGAGSTVLDVATVERLVLRNAVAALRGLGPVLAVMLVAGLAASYAQVGFILSAEPLTPKLERVSPVQGLRRLFSTRGLVRLGMALGKLAVVAAVVYLCLRSQWERLATLGDAPVQEICIALVRALAQLLFGAAVALGVLALLDYGYQWWQHEKDLRMSRRELLEELKHTEGDPQVRARIRQIQREIARRRMLHKVPQADVVITNPTHYAVALQYEAMRMRAPTVVAKGKNLLAKRIIRIAREKNVPITENPPLAQMLYKNVEVGEEVPATLYRAVAVVLAHIYRLRHEARVRVIT